MPVKLPEIDQVEFDEAEKLFEIGNYSQAIIKYKNVIEANAEYYPALNKLAQSYEKNSNKEQATVVYKRIIELNPNRHKSIAKLSKILAEYGDTKNAIAGFKKVISIEPDQPDWVFITLGNELKKKKQANNNN
jgi:tetratricopeptide (TPR) repeat protein